jgi:hypothetical protein
VREPFRSQRISIDVAELRHGPPRRILVADRRIPRPTFVGAFCRCSACSIKGGYCACQVFGHCQRTRCDAGRHSCMGSKQYDRKDARSHHAKDAPGEEHRTGSIRICARSPQAEVQVTISISIHAESQNYPDYNWHARPLKALIMQLRQPR